MKFIYTQDPNPYTVIVDGVFSPYKLVRYNIQLINLTNHVKEWCMRNNIKLDRLYFSIELKYVQDENGTYGKPLFNALYFYDPIKGKTELYQIDLFYRITYRSNRINKIIQEISSY